LTDKPKSIGIFIGSEGGFSPEEVGLAVENGAQAATLGKRILRAETAPLAALSIIMYQTDNF
jgi:16S rRNA (uracil1498-N3)-methyltransferase